MVGVSIHKELARSIQGLNMLSIDKGFCLRELMNLSREVFIRRMTITIVSEIEIR